MYGINLCLDCIYTIIKNGKSHFNRSDRITRIVWICRTYTCSPFSVHYAINHPVDLLKSLVSFNFYILQACTLI